MLGRGLKTSRCGNWPASSSCWREIAKGGTHVARSVEEILAVRLEVCVFQGAELQEVRRAVLLVIVLLGICELEAILHGLAVLHSHEVVVPRAVVGHHVEAHEAVRQQHLHLLVVSREVPVRVGAVVLVLAAPLIALRGELVGCEGARARREGAGNQHATLAVPGLVCLQELGVRCDVLGTHLRELVWLCVYPSERLEVPEVLVLGQR